MSADFALAITFGATHVRVGTAIFGERRRGVFSSLARSARLTRGHGWKIFGLMLLMYFCNAIVDSPIDQALSGIPAFAGHVIWNGVWSAFYAILAVVTYHDLRVAKEGVDIEQIAAVFE